MEPHASSLQILTGAFYYAFLIIFLLTYIFVFRLGKNVEFKRKWWPRFLVLFVVFTALKLAFFMIRTSSSPAMAQQQMPFMVMLAVIAAMVFFRLKKTRFCDKCSALIRGRLYGSKKSCPKCGTELHIK